MNAKFKRVVSMLFAVMLFATTIGSDVLTAKAVEKDDEIVDTVVEESAPLNEEESVSNDFVDNFDNKVDDEVSVIEDESAEKQDEKRESEVEEECEDKEKDEEHECKFDESLDVYRTVNGVVVSAKAEAGVFPDGTQMSVEPVGNEDEAVKAVEEVTENHVTKEDIFAVDISFYIDGEEIQPNGTVDISFENLNLKGDKLQVFHINDETKVAETVSGKVANSGNVDIEADSFSVYVILTLSDDLSEKVKGGKLEYKTPQKQSVEYNAQYQTVKDIVASDIVVEGQSEKAAPMVTYSTEANGTYSEEKPQFKNVGTYTVFYKLNYPGYIEETGSVEFEITKSDDAVIKNLAIKPWKFGLYDSGKNAPSAEISSTLDAETTIEDVTFVYEYFDKKGNSVEDITAALPGTYKVEATATTNNYVDVTTELDFTISKATVSYCITGAGINNWSGIIATGELKNSYYEDYAELATYAKDVRGINGKAAADYAKKYTTNVRSVISMLKDAGYSVDVTKFSTVRDTIHVDFVITDKPVVTMESFTYGETLTPSYVWIANDSYKGFTPAIEDTNYTVTYMYYGITKSHNKIGSKESPVETAPTEAGDYKVKVVIDAKNSLYDCESAYVSYSIGQAVAEFDYVITNSKLSDEVVAADRKKVDGIETVIYNDHHYTVSAVLANPVSGDEGVYATVNDNYQEEVGKYTSTLDRIKNADGTKNCFGNNRSQAKKIVATTIYAPADRFLRIELSRVFEATIYGFSKPKLLSLLYQITHMKLQLFSILVVFMQHK